MICLYWFYEPYSKSVVEWFVEWFGVLELGVMKYWEFVL